MKSSTLVLAFFSLAGVLSAPTHGENVTFHELGITSQYLHKRTTQTWADAVKKGKIRIMTMNTAIKKGVDRSGGASQLAKLVEDPAGPKQTSKFANAGFRTQMNSFLGLDASKETFYAVDLKIEDEEDAFIPVAGHFSPADGVIVAESIEKSKDVTIEISEALYYEHLMVAKTHGIGTPASVAKRINGLVVFYIHNEDTKAQMSAIYAQKSEDKLKDDIIVSPKGEDKDSFYALVGTPNGAAAAYMLADHSVAMSKTKIDSVMIVHGKENTLIFKYA